MSDPCRICHQDFYHYSELQTRCHDCRRNDPEYRRERNRRHHVIRRHKINPAKWRKIRARVIERDKCCQFCRTTDDLTVDHIVPLADGGDSETTNLRVLCDPCHQALTREFNKVYSRRLAAR